MRLDHSTRFEPTTTDLPTAFSIVCLLEEWSADAGTDYINSGSTGDWGRLLINYRHPKGRCVQVVDEPSMNLVFDRLYVDSKGVPFNYVPEPSPGSYEGRRPEARVYAPNIGISISFEFGPSPSATSGHRLYGLQTLFYPAELERQLRKMATLAKTAIEETGSNMLYLVFGFLEFYDSEDSERPMWAPLLALPVALVRGDLDEDTRTYQFIVQHNGEDLAENHTLREKLRRDFVLSLPDFGEDDDPEDYLARVENAIKNKRRWKVRRQITLGMLSFGKLAIWADLDTKKNSGLVDHDLIKAIFSGGSSGDSGAFHAEDYRIDELSEADEPLIYDADSSQHSAILDVLAGKNLVVNGPPGTGKSQTITNIIAAALSSGKKVLFVSEKLAALEVVRHRLNQAGLGDFCLELHSHKTQKKKFLEDIEARIERRFPAPVQFQAKLALLSRQKKELARHAEIMGSRIGNALGLTVNEVFWAAERRRQELGDLAAEVNAIDLREAVRWTYDEIESRKAQLSALAELFGIVGRFDSSHPWWGFRPAPLAPTDDDAIARTIQQALTSAIRADVAAAEAIQRFGLVEQPDASSASKLSRILQRIPEVPDGADATLLPRMFDGILDPKGQRSLWLLSKVASGVGKARSLYDSAARVLEEGAQLADEAIAAVRQLAEQPRFSAVLLGSDTGVALKAVDRLEQTLFEFSHAVRLAQPPYAPLGRSALESCLATINQLRPELETFQIGPILSRASAVQEVINAITVALGKISAIADRNGLSFNSTRQELVTLADPAGLPGLSKDAVVDSVALTEARRIAELSLAERPIEEIQRVRSLLIAHASAFAEALGRCRLAAESLGVAFDATDRSVMEVAALAKVALSAPADLLEYRRPTFGYARAKELVENIRTALAADKSDRVALESLFYLDALPALDEIKASVGVLRRKTGVFAFFNGDWRKAKALHVGLCVRQQKIPSRQRADELARLATWIEARNMFVSDIEHSETFGHLYRGFETDITKLSRLLDWYSSSRVTLTQCPGLVDRVDLTVVSADRLLELAAISESVIRDCSILNEAEATLKKILGAGVVGFREAKARDWDRALEWLHMAIEHLGRVTDFFGTRADARLTPKSALRLMEARAELNAVSAELALLNDGDRLLREAAGEELGLLLECIEESWADAVQRISNAASCAVAAATQARSIVGTDATLGVARRFAETKLGLDVAWRGVATLPETSRIDDWAGLMALAEVDVAAAKQLLERVASLVKLGASVTEFLSAAKEVSEGRAILDQFYSSDEVHRLLGDLFNGADTDLDCLAKTHEWGLAICDGDVPRELRTMLLSPDASQTLVHARRLYREIDEGCATARQKVETLNSYGSFDWDRWQRQVRATPGRDLPIEIRSRLEVVADAPGSVLAWSKYLDLRQRLRHEGIGDFVMALEERRIPPAALAPAFELAFYQAIGTAIYQSIPELSRFNGFAHEKTRSDYRDLDGEIVSLTGKDFASQIAKRTRVPEGQRGSTVGEFTEMHLLRREINKQRKHIPIRQLVKRAGNALQELKPCFMMGPLSVAQYLEHGTLKFDLVVMDEASQLRPEDALGAVARGSQLVVVGDPKQLPPTNFFDRMLDAGDDEDEDEAPAAISGMESILDICQQLFTPVRSLRWHYRSHHESLIAFSNHHFYNNLVIFPSPFAKNPGLGVKYRYVKDGTYKDRQNLPEAQRLVDAVLEHMLKRPDESLGVVTLNQTQRDLIEELLDKKLRHFPEAADFLNRWEIEGWPFFVKNLENVQGDERDVIFISTTFGKALGTARPRQNFGPISRRDGWRRLNVLFTRSKRRIELFTSMAPDDIVVDEKTPLGTKALRDYLDFAKHGVLVTTNEDEREPDSDFEVSVANVIRALDYEVKPQLGVAGFFIDLAVRNPDRPGEFLAGIECDGASYHSGFSVRDRDRIRQEILESLGWRGRIYRIWSTDWFYDPRREAERLRSFLEERRRISAGEARPDREGEFQDENDESDDAEKAGPESGEIVAASSDESADLFVEVGDRVSYCFVDDPSERHTVLIVDSESNTKRGIVNERTPVAQALLGLSPGDVGDLDVAGHKRRQLRVLKIQRQEDIFT